MKILIVYGTTEGHTRIIAERIGTWLRESGHLADVFDSTALPPNLQMGAYDAIIVAASIHVGKHQSSVTHFVKDHLYSLQSKPSALVSSSLAAVVQNEEHSAEVQGCIDRFLEETGWRPTAVTAVAGALLYTQYDWLKRMLLKQIVKRQGGDTDTSHDYEYTDWDSLRKFVTDFAGKVSG